MADKNNKNNQPPRDDSPGGLAAELGVSRESIDLALSLGKTPDEIRTAFKKTAPKKPTTPAGVPKPPTPPPAATPPKVTPAPTPVTPAGATPIFGITPTRREERIRSIIRGAKGE